MGRDNGGAEGRRGQVGGGEGGEGRHGTVRAANTRSNPCPRLSQRKSRLSDRQSAGRGFSGRRRAATPAPGVWGRVHSGETPGGTAAPGVTRDGDAGGPREGERDWASQCLFDDPRPATPGGLYFTRPPCLSHQPGLHWGAGGAGSDVGGPGSRLGSATVAPGRVVVATGSDREVPLDPVTSL